MADATAVQPDISLGVRPPAISGANPLTTLGGLSEIQNRLNANRLFQQEFYAKQKAGQIISQSDSMEDAIPAMLADPDVAAFAPGIINNIRQTQSTQMDIATKQQALNNTALGAVLHGTGMALASGDIGSLADSINAGMALVPPEAREATRSAVGSYVRALGEDLNKLPPDQQRAELQKRNAALMMQNNFTPESTAAMMGTTLPAVSFQPIGAGGATVPVQTGGFGGGAGVPVSIAGSAGQSQDGNLLTGTSATGVNAAGGVSGPGMAQQQFMTDRGKQMAQYATELDDAVKNGNVLMQTIQEAREAQQNFKAGGGASVYAHIAQVAQAFGAPNDLVDRIANGDLSASQEFGKIANNFVMGQLRQSLQGIGGSRINQQEFAAFTKNNPNLETDPRAIDKIFQFWSRQHNYNVAEQQSLAEHLKQPNFDITTWPAQWQKIAQQQHMVNMSTQEAGGQRPAAVTAPQVDFHWVPGKGLVPATNAPTGTPLEPAGTADLR